MDVSLGLGLFPTTSISQSNNTFIRTADDSPVTVAGKGTMVPPLKNGKSVRLKNCHHEPGLSVSLLSVSAHRRRGNGCSFLADENECGIGFPTFSVDIDDTADCAILCRVPSDPTDAPSHHCCDDEASPVRTPSQSPLARCSHSCNAPVSVERPLLACKMHTRSDTRWNEATQPNTIPNPTPSPSPTRNAKTHPSMPLPDEDNCGNADIWAVEGVSDEWESVDPWEDSDPEDDNESCSHDSISDSGLQPRIEEPVPRHTGNWLLTEVENSAHISSPFPKSCSSTADSIDDSPIPCNNASLPTHCIPESHWSKEKVRVVDHRLCLLLGNCKSHNCSALSSTFTNCVVFRHGEVPLSVGDFVNKKCGRRGKHSQEPCHAGHTVCVDIVCSNGVSPGGHWHGIPFLDEAS